MSDEDKTLSGSLNLMASRAHILQPEGLISRKACKQQSRYVTIKRFFDAYLRVLI